MKNLKLLLALMTPAAWLVLGLAALLFLGAGGAVGYRVASGIAETAALKVANDRAAERLASGELLARETKKVTDLERARAADVAAVGETLQKVKDDAKTKIDSLTADVRAGAVRLSIAVKAQARPAAASCSAGVDSASAAVDPQESRAELVPETANALIGIAADGDDAVRDLNACIASYDALRADHDKTTRETIELLKDTP